MATSFSRGAGRAAAFIGPVLWLVSSTGWAQDDDFPGVLPATTVQLPTFGISIDAEGTLDLKTVKDFDGRLLRERLAAAKAAKPGELWAASKLRKVLRPQMGQSQPTSNRFWCASMVCAGARSRTRSRLTAKPAST